MISGENLIWNFERNASYLRTHLAGLTHADSLVQPPVNGNCINWIVGHLVCYRNFALEICGLPLVVSTAVANRYERGSMPVTEAATNVAAFEMLVEAYWHSHEQLVAYLCTLTQEQASEVVSAADFTMPRSELLTSFMRHESYHAGQLELLRELALATR
jgi:hypothetical protein